jgi:hypothetical protein
MDSRGHGRILHFLGDEQGRYFFTVRLPTPKGTVAA